MVCFILPIGVRQKDKAKKIRRMVGWGLIPQSLSYPFVMWGFQVLSGISHSKHVVLHLKVPIYQLEYWTVVGGKIREQDFPEMPLVHWSYRGAQRLCKFPAPGGRMLRLCSSVCLPQVSPLVPITWAESMAVTVHDGDRAEHWAGAGGAVKRG